MHYVEQIWGGFVLSEREENRYHDSYFHITVWDASIGAQREFQYASTAGGNPENCGPMGYETIKRLVALTPEHIKDLAQKWRDRQVRAKQVEYLIAHKSREDIGATVKVTRGRKVAKGTVGRIMTIRQECVHRAYSDWATKNRHMAMLDTSNGFPIVDLANCDVLQPSPQRAQLLFDLAS